MAENLGDLIVRISTDLTELKKGLNDADKSVSQTSAKMEKSIKDLSRSMTIAGAAITGAFGLMIKSAVDYGDEIFEVSQRTGIATETLSTLKFVADQTESSFADLTTGLRFLSRNIFESENGNAKAAEAFNRLGINVRDAAGNLKSADAVFLEAADRISKLSSEAAKTSLAIDLFGRSGQSLLPVLNLGANGIRELQQRARDLGLELNATNAKSIDEFSDKLKESKEALGGLWLTISLQILPALTSFANNVTNTIVAVQKWTRENPLLTATIVELTAKLGLILLILGSIGGIVTGLITNVRNLTLAIAALHPAVLAVGVGFAAWNVGLLLGQIKQVQDIMTWIEAHLTPEGIARQSDEAILQQNQKQIQTAAEARGVNLSELPGAAAPVSGFGTDSITKQEEEATVKSIELTNKRREAKIKAEQDATKAAGEEAKKKLTLEDTFFTGSLGNLAGYLTNVGQQNKAAATAAKVINIGLAVMSTAAGVARAFKDYPWPYSMIVAGIVGAAGALQIGTIAAQGFAEGTDTVPSMLSPGEMVVPRSFADSIRQGALTLGGPGGGNAGDRGGDNNIQIYLTAVINNDLDVKDTAERLAFATNQELRYIR